MPGLSGIDATRQIVNARPQTSVLVLTMLEDDGSLFAAIRAGARGYLLKGADQDDIVHAVQSVARGEALFGPGIATRVLGFFATAHFQQAPSQFPQLTDREREVLELIAQGKPNPAIARQLSLSPKTVMNYVSSIFAKLHVADRSEAIVRAREQGLGQGSVEGTLPEDLRRI
ncbi:hypothetical protein BH23ACT12_BH23ACT12_08990 [soil metagenome]